MTASRGPDQLGIGIVVEDLCRTYPDGSGLLPTDLVVEHGEFVSVLGPSGCGKSTLLRCLAGLDRPQRGRIRFGDRVVFDAGQGVFVPPHRREPGMVFQDLALWPHLSVGANVAFPLRVRGVGRAEMAARVADALAKVDLEASAAKMPHQLSGGQQQRVAIARAIVARPRLLLMDEPLSALDAALRAQLRTELRALTTELGVTTVYVTHDQAEAMSMSDRIVVMRAGRVHQHGSPEELYDKPANSFVAEFVGSFNPLPDGISGIRAGRVRVLADDETAPSDQRTVAATVRTAVFAGGGYELGCDVAGVDRLWIVTHRHTYSPGAEVHLAFASEDVIILAS